MSTPERKPDLKVFIIAPSQYEQSGELKQHSVGLMLPPAFAVLDGIIEASGRSQGVSIVTEHINERTENGEGYINRIIRQSKDRSLADNYLVFLTIKSFELSRALDIDRMLIDAKVKTVLGGFGVTLADIETYKYLIRNGLPFAKGEGENIVGQAIKDALENRIKPCYWQQGYVDLRKAPLPKLPGKNEHNLTITHYAALGSSEGCPFSCGFCTVIECRGRSMTPDRSRNVKDCVNYIREASERGFGEIMLTADNLRRAFNYNELKKALIALNQEQIEKTGKGLHLLVQMDLEESILDEIEELAAMGVKNIFFGMESSDRLALDDEHKKQNKPEMYPVIAEKCHRNGITVSSGVMTCFRNQTPASIHQDMLNFNKFVDLAHPYAVTPLPQSDDWVEAVRERQLTTWDPNSYDSTLCIRDYFNNMTMEQAQAAYYRSFTDLFPLNDMLRERLELSWKDKILRRLYGRGLAEYGKRLRGRPWHMMMDGIPRIGGEIVRRPADSFRGIPLDPDDPIYESKKTFKDAKDEYLATIT